MHQKNMALVGQAWNARHARTILSPVIGLSLCAGAEMVWATYGALLSPEGWLDQEAHESDLRGSRGVALAGALMIFMGVANFRHTARPPPA